MSLVGEFKEILFADLLQFYCLSGQTAAVSVKSSDERGLESTGTFFIDGGALVDAHFDGREGADAVRRAVRRLRRGAFQVELGGRSERRTVHEPWSALVLEELRQLDVQRQRPVPLPLPASWLTVPSPSLEPPSHPTPAPAPVPTPMPRRRSTDHLAAPSTTPTPSTGTPAVTPAPAGRTPTPSRGVAVVAGTPAVARAPAPPPPPTAPFPRPAREPLFGGQNRWVLVVVGALLAGGGLAVVTDHLLGEFGESPEISLPTVAAPRTPAGVTETEVVFGMAAPLSGASRELGRQRKVGLEVAFAAANAEGGIHGRQVRLVTVDDGDEPSRTRELMRELAEQHGVFGFVGNRGASPSDVIGRQMLDFGTLGGAQPQRREAPERTAFGYRANLEEETRALVRYLLNVRHLRPEQIAVFAQDDRTGEAGYQGVLAALRRVEKGLPPPFKVTYPRNTSDVAGGVARIVERGDRVRAVVLLASYRAAAHFVEQVKIQRPQMTFASASVAGSTALADELMQLGPRFASGVLVTQVVPLPTSRSSLVLKYQDALAAYAPDEKPDFVSLEGYLEGSLLLEGLRRSGHTVTTENMVRALETIRGLDLGLGTTLSFDPGDHQGSHKVWGTVLDSTGNYQPIDLE